MKKKFLLVLVVLVVGLMGLYVYAEEGEDPPVTLRDVIEDFENQNLWEAILNYLGLDPETDGLDKNVEYITELNISGRYLESLDGLEIFTALEELNASNNVLEDIDLSANVSLVDLDISGNNLERLYLPGNVELKRINASNNNLNEVDLSSNVNLQYVDLSGNEDLDSIDLRVNILLERVDLRGTGVTDPIPGLPDNMEPHEDDDLLFYAQEEIPYVPKEPDYEYDRLPVNTAQVKERLFGEINWDAVMRGDRVQNILLRVELTTGPDGDWFAQWAEVLDADDIAADPDEPGPLVTVFSWILVFAAVLSFILSIVLFALRKE